MLVDGDESNKFGLAKGRHTVAAKIARPDSCHFNLASITAERKNLEFISTLNHPNLLKFFGAVASLDESKIYLCTEFCSGGSLRHYLRKMKASNEVVSFQLQFHWIRQICSGMRFLAANNLMHCDLATRNILLVDNGNKIKIADFGLSIRGNNGVQYLNSLPDHLRYRPWRWSAPENFDFPGKIAQNGQIVFPVPICTYKSDVWSYGVLIWEICTYGEEPYVGIGKTIREIGDVLSKIVNENDRLLIPRNAHPVLVELMRQCWTFDTAVVEQNSRLCRHQSQETRPSFDQIWKKYFS